MGGECGGRRREGGLQLKNLPRLVSGENIKSSRYRGGAIGLFF